MANFVTKLLELPEIVNVKDLDSTEASLKHKEIILSKPLLKQIYLNWYNSLIGNFDSQSKILEIGSGGGFIKEVFPNVITSDIKELPNCDKIVDAQQLPFENQSLDGIVMVNVFHHIPDCESFLYESQRVLKKNGRIVMVEPANCGYSRFIYKNFHHEPFEINQDGWKFQSKGPLSDSNQALPFIVFERDENIFKQKFENLKIKNIAYHSPLAYLISGGLSMRSLTPKVFNSLLIKTDKVLSSKNFCMFCTIEVEKF